jgi:hypothetical protein
MAYRVIHLIDSEAGNYQWPFSLASGFGQRPTASRRLLLWLVRTAFVGRGMSCTRDTGCQVYRVETQDGRDHRAGTGFEPAEVGT